MLHPLTPGSAIEIATLPDWGIVYIIPQGAGTVRLGTEKGALEATGGQVGLVVRVADDPRVPIWWKGSMWAIADVIMNIDVQTPGFTGTMGYRRSGRI